MYNFKLKFQAVAEKTAKNFRGLLYFAESCIWKNEITFCQCSNETSKECIGYVYIGPHCTVFITLLAILILFNFCSHIIKQHIQVVAQKQPRFLNFSPVFNIFYSAPLSKHCVCYGISICPSVCLSMSVRHTAVLCQDEGTQNYAVLTIR